MGIAPIAAVRPLGPIKASLAEPQVEPPFALNQADRMHEDAYQGGQESAERGMEEEDSLASETANIDETLSTPEDSNTHLSFFA